MAKFEIGGNLALLLVVIVVALVLALMITLAASAGILRETLTGLAATIVLVCFLSAL